MLAKLASVCRFEGAIMSATITAMAMLATVYGYGEDVGSASYASSSSAGGLTGVQTSVENLDIGRDGTPGFVTAPASAFGGGGLVSWFLDTLAGGPSARRSCRR
jgi:hypothetical protein